MADELTLEALKANYDGSRELISLTIPKRFGALGGKVVHYYNVVTVAERRAATIRQGFDTDTGRAFLDDEAIVYGLIARLKKADGTPMFFLQHAPTLLKQCDGDLLGWLWRAIGGVGVDTVTVEDAEGNSPGTSNSD